MKKLYNFLKRLFCGTIGVFIGIALYQVFWCRNHPEIYAFDSAPWYTNILVYGVFTLVIAAVLGAVLWLLKQKADRDA